MFSSQCFCYKSREVLGLEDKTIVNMYGPLPCFWLGQMIGHAMCSPFSMK